MTAAQWAAEKICERAARQKNTKLGPYFWRSGEWGAYFRRQVGEANKVVKRFGGAAVAAALRRKDLEWCRSLAAPQFLKACEQELGRLSRPEPESPPAATPEPPAKPPVPVSAGPPSRLSRIGSYGKK